LKKETDMWGQEKRKVRKESAKKTQRGVKSARQESGRHLCDRYGGEKKNAGPSRGRRQRPGAGKLGKFKLRKCLTRADKTVGSLIKSWGEDGMVYACKGKGAPNRQKTRKCSPSAPRGGYPLVTRGGKIAGM